MAQNNVLVATGVTYYHPNDEAAFFEWLDRMECVDSYRGEIRDLFITLKRRPTKYDLGELLAFFFRYGIDMAQLARFETKANRAWLRDPQKYWHHRVFGEKLPGGTVGQDRLGVWHDGSAICVIAVGSHGDPLDLGEHEAEDLIAKLQGALAEDRA
jgi:hypothetical protein